MNSIFYRKIKLMESESFSNDKRTVFADRYGNIYYINWDIKPFELNECEPFVGARGYMHVFIGTNKAKKAIVHQIVADAWYGKLPKGHHAHHIDFNKQNNRLNNLTYIKKSEHINIHKEYRCFIPGEYLEPSW